MDSHINTKNRPRLGLRPKEIIGAVPMKGMMVLLLVLTTTGTVVAQQQIARDIEKPVSYYTVLEAAKEAELKQFGRLEAGFGTHEEETRQRIVRFVLLSERLDNSLLAKENLNPRRTTQIAHYDKGVLTFQVTDEGLSMIDAEGLYYDLPIEQQGRVTKVVMVYNNPSNSVPPTVHAGNNTATGTTFPERRKDSSFSLDSSSSIPNALPPAVRQPSLNQPQGFTSNSNDLNVPQTAPLKTGAEILADTRSQNAGTERFNPTFPRTNLGTDTTLPANSNHSLANNSGALNGATGFVPRKESTGFQPIKRPSDDLVYNGVERNDRTFQARQPASQQNEEQYSRQDLKDLVRQLKSDSDAELQTQLKQRESQLLRESQRREDVLREELHRERLARSQDNRVNDTAKSFVDPDDDYFGSDSARSRRRPARRDSRMMDDDIADFDRQRNQPSSGQISTGIPVRQMHTPLATNQNRIPDMSIPGPNNNTQLAEAQNVSNPSSQNESAVTTKTHSDLLAKFDKASSQNGVLWVMLLFSIAANFYVCFLARGFYVRYGELADELRDTFTTSV